MSLVQSYYAELENSKKILKELANSLLQQLEDAGVVYALSANFNKGLQSICDGIIPNPTTIKVLSGEANFYTKTGKSKGELESFEKVLNTILLPIGSRIVEKLNYLQNIEIFLERASTFCLLSILNQQLIKYRDEENILLLSDINAFFSETLKDQDVNFMFEKLGTRYEHLLLDEFQDTSSFQWNNLLPLIKNSISEGHHTIIVGDPKQSIYRWRGANPTIITQRVFDELQMFVDHNTKQSLSTNYRSSKSIIEFNNQFFPYLISILKNQSQFINTSILDEVYNEVIQQYSNNHKGLVSIHLLEKQEITSDDIASDITVNEIALQRTIATIKHNIELGYDYNDLLILAATNNELLTIGNTLLEAGIPYHSESNKKLGDIPEVLQLVTLMKYALGHRDAVTTKELELILAQDTEKIIELLTFDNHNKTFIDHKELDKLVRESSSIYQITISLIEKYLPLLFGNASIQFFLHTLIKANGELNLQFTDFMEWWQSDGHITLVPGTGNMNAVKLLTIHKSKGLESPIVIVPFCNIKFASKNVFWSELLPDFLSKDFPVFPLPNRMDMLNTAYKDAYIEEYKGQALEKLNVVYVALTRAGEKMFLFTPKNIPKKNSKTKEEDDNSNATIKATMQEVLNKFIDTTPPSYVNIELGIFNYGEDIRKNTQQKEVMTQPNQIFYTLTLFNKPIPINSQLANQVEEEVFLYASYMATKMGIIVHKIFEKSLLLKDFNAQIKSMHITGVINNSEYDELTNLFDEITILPIIQDWFSGNYEVWREREILINGHVIRPDRVLLKNKDAIIIDFKREKEDERYATQINEYAHSLEHLGYHVISKNIFYTQSLQIKSF